MPGFQKNLLADIIDNVSESIYLYKESKDISLPIPVEQYEQLKLELELFPLNESRLNKIKIKMELEKAEKQIKIDQTRLDADRNYRDKINALMKDVQRFDKQILKELKDAMWEYQQNKDRFSEDNEDKNERLIIEKLLTAEEIYNKFENIEKFKNNEPTRSIMDPYEVLGVSRKAENDEINSAYRRKILEVHPDKHNQENSEFWQKETLKIQQARQLLIDPISRSQYDSTHPELKEGPQDLKSAKEYYDKCVNEYKKLRREKYKAAVSKAENNVKEDKTKLAESKKKYKIIKNNYEEAIKDYNIEKDELITKIIEKKYGKLLTKQVEAFKNKNGRIDDSIKNMLEQKIQQQAELEFNELQNNENEKDNALNDELQIKNNIRESIIEEEELKSKTYVAATKLGIEIQNIEKQYILENSYRKLKDNAMDDTYWNPIEEKLTSKIANTPNDLEKIDSRIQKELTQLQKNIEKTEAQLIELQENIAKTQEQLKKPEDTDNLAKLNQQRVELTKAVAKMNQQKVQLTEKAIKNNQNIQFLKEESGLEYLKKERDQRKQRLETLKIKAKDIVSRDPFADYSINALLGAKQRLHRLEVTLSLSLKKLAQLQKNPEFQENKDYIHINKVLARISEELENIKQEKRLIAQSMYERLMLIKQSKKDDPLADVINEQESILANKIKPRKRTAVISDLTPLYDYIEQYGDESLKNKLHEEFRKDKNTNKVESINYESRLLEEYFPQNTFSIPLPILTNNFTPSWNLINTDVWKALSNQQADLELKNADVTALLKSKIGKMSNVKQLSNNLRVEITRRLEELLNNLRVRITQRLEELITQKVELLEISITGQENKDLSQITNPLEFINQLKATLGHLKQEVDRYGTNETKIKFQKIENNAIDYINQISNYYIKDKSKVNEDKSQVNINTSKSINKIAFGFEIQKDDFWEQMRMRSQNELKRLKSNLIKLKSKDNIEYQNINFNRQMYTVLNDANTIELTKELGRRRENQDIVEYGTPLLAEETLSDVPNDVIESEMEFRKKEAALKAEIKDEERKLKSLDLKLVDLQIISQFAHMSSEELLKKSIELELVNPTERIQEFKVGIAYAMSHRLELMARDNQEFNDDPGSDVFDRLKDLWLIPTETMLEGRGYATTPDPNTIEKFYDYIEQYGDKETKENAKHAFRWSNIRIATNENNDRFIVHRKFEDLLTSSPKNLFPAKKRGIFKSLSKSEKWRYNFFKDNADITLELDHISRIKPRQTITDQLIDFSAISRLWDMEKKILANIRKNENNKPPRSWIPFLYKNENNLNDDLRFQWSKFLYGQRTLVLEQQLNLLENWLNIPSNDRNKEALLLKELANPKTEARLKKEIEKLRNFNPLNVPQRKKIDEINRLFNKHLKKAKSDQDTILIETKLKELSPNETIGQKTVAELEKLAQDFKWLEKLNHGRLEQKYILVINDAIKNYSNTVNHQFTNNKMDKTYILAYEDLLGELAGYLIKEEDINNAQNNLESAKQSRVAIESNKSNYFVNTYNNFKGKSTSNDMQLMKTFATEVWDPKAFNELNIILGIPTESIEMTELESNPLWQRILKAQNHLENQLNAVSKKDLTSVSDIVTLDNWQNYLAQQQKLLEEKQMELFNKWLNLDELKKQMSTLEQIKDKKTDDYQQMWGLLLKIQNTLQNKLQEIATSSVKHENTWYWSGLIAEYRSEYLAKQLDVLNNWTHLPFENDLILKKDVVIDDKLFNPMSKAIDDFNIQAAVLNKKFPKVEVTINNRLWKLEIVNKMYNLLNLDTATSLTQATELTQSNTWQQYAEMQESLKKKREELLENDDDQVFLKEQQSRILDKQISLLKTWINQFVDAAVSTQVSGVGRKTLNVSLLRVQLQQLQKYMDTDANVENRVEDIIDTAISYYQSKLEDFNQTAKGTQPNLINLKAAVELEILLEELASPNQAKALINAARQRLALETNTGLLSTPIESKEWKIEFLIRIEHIAEEIASLEKLIENQPENYQVLWNTLLRIQTTLANKLSELKDDTSQKNWIKYIEGQQRFYLNKQFEILNNWTNSPFDNNENIKKEVLVNDQLFKPMTVAIDDYNYRRTVIREAEEVPKINETITSRLWKLEVANKVHNLLLMDISSVTKDTDLIESDFWRQSNELVEALNNEDKKLLPEDKDGKAFLKQQISYVREKQTEAFDKWVDQETKPLSLSKDEPEASYKQNTMILTKMFENLSEKMEVLKAINNIQSQYWIAYLENEQQKISKMRSKLQIDFLDVELRKQENWNNAPFSTVISELGNDPNILSKKTTDMFYKTTRFSNLVEELPLNNSVKETYKEIIKKSNLRIIQIKRYQTLQQLSNIFNNDEFIYNNPKTSKTDLSILVDHWDELESQEKVELRDPLLNLIDPVSKILQNIFNNAYDLAYLKSVNAKALEQLSATIKILPLTNRKMIYKECVKIYYEAISKLQLDKLNTAEKEELASALTKYETLLTEIDPKQTQMQHAIKYREAVFTPPDAVTAFNSAYDGITDIYGKFDLSRFDQAMQFAQLWKPSTFKPLSSLLLSETDTPNEQYDIDEISNSWTQIDDLMQALAQEQKNFEAKFSHSILFTDKKDDWLNFLKSANTKLAVTAKALQANAFELVISQAYEKLLNSQDEQEAYTNAIEFLTDHSAEIPTIFDKSNDQMIEQFNNMLTKASTIHYHNLINLETQVKANLAKTSGKEKAAELTREKDLLQRYTSSKTLLTLLISKAPDKNDPAIIANQKLLKKSNDLYREIREKISSTEPQASHNGVFAQKSGKATTEAEATSQTEEKLPQPPGQS